MSLNNVNQRLRARQTIVENVIMVSNESEKFVVKFFGDDTTKDMESAASNAI